MSTKRPDTPRCVECRKPVDDTADAYTRDLAPSTRMSDVHRRTRSYWHPACWTAATVELAASRAASEERVVAELRNLAASAGLPEERIAELLAKRAADFDAIEARHAEEAKVRHR